MIKIFALSLGMMLVSMTPAFADYFPSGNDPDINAYKEATDKGKTTAAPVKTGFGCDSCARHAVDFGLFNSTNPTGSAAVEVKPEEGKE